MAIFEVTSSTFQKVPETTFAQERLRSERICSDSCAPTFQS
jgi:hypothetical protein